MDGGQGMCGTARPRREFLPAKGTERNLVGVFCILLIAGREDLV